MINIHPISDLRNRTNEILEVAHSEDRPVFITRNGKGDLVVMSLAHYERMQGRLELYEKLAAAEAQAEAGEVGISHADMMAQLRARIDG